MATKTKKVDNQNNSNQKSRKKLILALILLLVGGVTAAFFTFSLTKEPTTAIIEIPTVEVGVMSSEDNEMHTVKAEFVVEVLGDGKGVSVTDVQSKIANLMAQLEYDKMTATGSTSYIVTNLEYRLAEYFDDVKITGLFISELGYDGINVSGSNSHILPSTGKNTDVFKGLFQNTP